MTSSRFRSAFIGGVSVLGGAALVSLAPLATAQESAPAGAGTMAQVQSEQGTIPPGQLPSPVTDASGVLEASEIAEIEDSIQQFKMDNQKSMFIVYLPSFGQYSSAQWVEQAVAANGGMNTLVVAFATEDRQFNLGADTSAGYWSEQELDDIESAVYGPLVEGDWAAAGLAAVEGAASSGQISGQSATWLAAGGVAVVAAGGGIWALSRRNRRKTEQQTLDTARELAPDDIDSLLRLPLETLETRSREAIVAADESVRRGREELDIAVAEFGYERTRPFTRAMNNATGALQRAYQTQQQLNDSIPETEPQQRSMLVEIISSCGLAQQALDEQSEKFAELRNLLVNASSKLDELTQRTISLRTRVEPARATLADLRSRYAPDMLESVADNVDMAVVALTEAEKYVEQGRDLEDRPAGKQGGLVSAIREAERAIELTDTLLVGVEHAEQNITTAQEGLDGLIREVSDELREAAELKERGTAQGVRADWQAFDSATAEAATTLEQARARADTDPLGAYTELMDSDSVLDEQLDVVRGSTSSQERQLALLDKQLATANAQIQAAEDLIASRGAVVQSQARTYLANAKQLAARAMQARTHNTRQAIEFARRAAAHAQRASQQAQSDVAEYRRRTTAQQGSGAGSLLAGMVIGQILGGGHGGFGGGFGGGGGGGGFSSRGGSF